MFWGPSIRGVDDVAARSLCAGCGVCAFLQPDDVRMVDVADEGRRPSVRAGADTSAALAACPGVELSHGDHPVDVSPALLADWGPILEVWEGFAADEEIRFRGSSGGAATAISLHTLEEAGFHGVLHITARPDAPLLNHTVLSSSRQELLAATGSRYAPASPCDRLDLLERAPGPCTFIGKPCDVAAVAKASGQRPALAERVGLTIAIFCAGTPSTAGTVEMVRRMGIRDPADVRSVRYRGNGWPGDAEVTAVVDGELVTRRMEYETSWGEVLQRHREWRCHVCIDHTGEFADIAVGDPWYREIQPDEPGRSLILVRTERGRQVLADAIAAGHVRAERVADDRLPASQPNLRRTRGAVGARVAVSRLLGVAAPRYERMPRAGAWWRLSIRQKIASLFGTVRRIHRRRLHRRRPPAPPGPAIPPRTPDHAGTAGSTAG